MQPIVITIDNPVDEDKIKKLAELLSDSSTRSTAILEKLIRAMMQTTPELTQLQKLELMQPPQKFYDVVDDPHIGDKRAAFKPKVLKYTATGKIRKR